MEKVLFISSRPIFPVVCGAQIRTAQQLGFLLKRFSVDVIYLSDKLDDDVTMEYVPSVGKVFKFYVPKWKCRLQTVRSIFNKWPLQVNYYYNKDVQLFIDKCINDYSCVFCNNIRTTQYVMYKKGICKIVDFVDSISMNYEKAYRTAKGINRLIYMIDSKRCREYEQKVLDSFDRAAIISEVDKQYILKWRKSYLL